MLSFVPGNKTTGGIATNKWDENRMNPPYYYSSKEFRNGLAHFENGRCNVNVG
jgi:hypothetical protein